MPWAPPESFRLCPDSGVDNDYAHPEFLSTPLVAAILARQERVAHLYLDRGATPGLTSEFDGCTPVQAARQAGLQSVEDRLCALGVVRPAIAVKRSSNWFSRFVGRGAG